MSELSPFYGSGYRKNPLRPSVDNSPTLLLDSLIDEKGNAVVRPVQVETLDDPYAQLSFDDFTIEKLLRAGVKLQPINVKIDTRFNHAGLDKEVNAFNERLSAISDKLFNLED